MNIDGATKARIVKNQSGDWGLHLVPEEGEICLSKEDLKEALALIRINSHKVHDSEWDVRIPISVIDIIAILERRIYIHESWLKWIMADGETAHEAERYGIGTEISHKTHIRQYRAAIEILKW